LAAAARRSEADCDYLRLLKIYISEACEARLGEKEKERENKKKMFGHLRVGTLRVVQRAR